MVTKILATVGSSMSVEEYRRTAMILCAANKYPFEQAIGSLGGASRWGTISIVNGIVTRIKQSTFVAFKNIDNYIVVCLYQYLNGMGSDQ